MAIKIEDGTGVSGANAYVSDTFITSYLTERNRQTENSWASKPSTTRQAAAINATDYIEQRWGPLFLGIKEFLDISAARATLTLSALPANAETVVIDGVTYTFNTALGGAYSVLIGASVEASLANLAAAISASPTGAGSTYGVGTAIHPTVSAAESVGDTLVAVAREKGTAGNGIAASETLAAGAWSSSTLVGGGDYPAPQPLSFPRRYIYDRDGVEVRGIPDKLKFATAEYAVRSLSADGLLPDPVVDSSGRTLVRTKEVVGPITEEFQYNVGSTIGQLLRPYPAADRLLIGYVRAGGGVIRG